MVDTRLRVKDFNVSMVRRIDKPARFLRYQYLPLLGDSVDLVSDDVMTTSEHAFPRRHFPSSLRERERQIHKASLQAFCPCHYTTIRGFECLVVIGVGLLEDKLMLLELRLAADAAVKRVLSLLLLVSEGTVQSLVVRVLDRLNLSDSPEEDTAKTSLRLMSIILVASTVWIAARIMNGVTNENLLNIPRQHRPQSRQGSFLRRTANYLLDTFFLRRNKHGVLATRPRLGTAGSHSSRTGHGAPSIPGLPSTGSLRMRGTAGGGANRPRANTGGSAAAASFSERSAPGRATGAATGAASRNRTRTESYNNYEEDDEEYYEFTPPYYWDDDHHDGADGGDDRSGPRHEYYYGPHRPCLTYETWTPPPTWSEASKTVLPFHHRLPLQRVIALRVSSECTIRILPPGSDRSSADDPPPPSSTTDIVTRSASAVSSEPALELPVQEVATHIQHAMGGVLQLYVKESSREEWMEHTFSSAALCAQFQTDLLALQLFGTAVYDMYRALELIHQGSPACPTSELVMHDRAMEFAGDKAAGGQGGSSTAPSSKTVGRSKGIAWDDVMRSLGSSFPSIRYRLEALWWKNALPAPSPGRRNKRASARRSMGQGGSQRMSSGAAPVKPPVGSERERGTDASQDDLSSLLTEDYAKKRLLLGPIDFFRLFAPTVEGGALPKVGAKPSRVEQLLRWRKRVARASVMVQAYVEARVVVNLGWNLGKPLPENYWRRRLAFDETLDNSRWDKSKENEYYEGTVSRDVMVRVRGIESLWRQPRWRLGLGHQVSQLSPVQGYSLVGIHTFQVRDGSHGSDDSFPFRPGMDPVEVLPTLRRLIEDFPHLHFFVSCLYPEYFSLSLCHVFVFVRSLPKGIDRSFDNNVNSFVNGTAADRSRKLELIIQLQPPEEGVTWVSWLMIIIVSFLLRLSFSGDSPPSQTTRGGDRTVLPAIRLSGCGDCHHFGGSLQALKPHLPKNYVSHLLHVDSRKNVALAMRILLTYFAKGGFKQDVVDFTYILAGRTLEELPERALATGRLVHGQLARIALPKSYIAVDETMAETDRRPRVPLLDSTTSLDSAALYFRLFVSDPIDATLSQIVNAFGAMSPRSGDDIHMNQFLDEAHGQDVTARVMHSSDVFEKAVNEIIQILEHIEVPVRKEQLRLRSTTQSMLGPFQSPLALAVEDENHTDDDLVAVPILTRVTRSDILRFFLASGCRHKRTVIRLVESATWNGLTFPIDIRLCRVELQQGQFFQQGFDKLGNPVLYFRNMLRGYWRKDVSSSVAAVLHRLDQSIRTLQSTNQDARFTLVVMMGKPHKPKTKKQSSREVGEGHEEETTDEHVELNPTVEADAETVGVERPMSQHHNPRVDYQEHYHVHSNKELIRSLIKILLDHYPERLHKAYVVVGHGNTAYTRSAVGASLGIAKYIKPARTREKIKFLVRYTDLQRYIDTEQLPTIAGGKAHVVLKAFEFN